MPTRHVGESNDLGYLMGANISLIKERLEFQGEYISGTHIQSYISTELASQYGNYVPTVLSDRYDAFLFIDQTQALHPINVTGQGDRVAAEPLANSYLPFLND